MLGKRTLSYFHLSVILDFYLFGYVCSPRTPTDPMTSRSFTIQYQNHVRAELLLLRKELWGLSWVRVQTELKRQGGKSWSLLLWKSSWTAAVPQRKWLDFKCAETSRKCFECTKMPYVVLFYSLFLPWLKTNSELSVLGLRLNAQWCDFQVSFSRLKRAIAVKSSRNRLVRNWGEEYTYPSTGTDPF